MRKEMLIYSEASRDPPMKYQVGFLKGLRCPHPFGNSLCCFCCCHPTKVRQQRGHRRGQQRVERSASPRMEQHVATKPGESEQGENSREDFTAAQKFVSGLPDESSVPCNPLQSILVATELCIPERNGIFLQLKSLPCGLARKQLSPH